MKKYIFISYPYTHFGLWYYTEIYFYEVWR